MYCSDFQRDSTGRWIEIQVSQIYGQRDTDGFILHISIKENGYQLFPGHIWQIGSKYLYIYNNIIPQPSLLSTC